MSDNRPPRSSWSAPAMVIARSLTGVTGTELVAVLGFGLNSLLVMVAVSTSGEADTAARVGTTVIVRVTEALTLKLPKLAVT